MLKLSAEERAVLAANDRAPRAANPLPLELLIKDKRREVQNAAAKLPRLRRELRELRDKAGAVR